jgi:thiamine-phosphate pyrophosphorylase
VKLIVVSPETVDPRECTVLAGLFAAGLERYHIRKPAVPAGVLEDWLQTLPADWRPRLVLHTQHPLVDKLQLGGRHYREGDALPHPRPPGFASRSCHDLGALRSACGRFDAVFLSPVFPSLSKPGHAPDARLNPADIAATLAARTTEERITEVIALGGITSVTATQARDLGFDGVAVLGAIWQATDPVRAFGELQDTLFSHAV